MVPKLKENSEIKKVNNFCSKYGLKLIIVAVISLIAAVIFEYVIYKHIVVQSFYSKNRIMLVTLIFSFIGIHFVFKLSEMYDWIYKNRYKIACAFLLFMMIFKYSGSSITQYNKIIQPGADDSRYNPLLGFERDVRTDEWASSTMYILSQSESEDKFQYFNDTLRGTSTDMFTLVNAPVLDILMVGKPFQTGFLLFGNDMGMSFFWYGRLVAMLLGSFELCMVLTKKNKRVSLCGMLIITFSAATQWWYCMDTLIWGQIILVLIDKFMNTDKKHVKYLCASGLVSSILAYVFVLYPAWQVSFAYVFLAIFIWMMIKNLKTYKFNLHDIIVILVTVGCIVGLLARWYILSGDTIKAIMNTDYPGNRTQVGGGTLTLYSYFYNIFFPYKHFPNPCEFSSMLSFYPIPMFLGALYLIRNKKNWSFIIPVLLGGIFLTVWCKYGFSETMAKLTLMSMSTASRATLAVGIINIYMLIYLLGIVKEEDKLINKNLTYVITALATVYMAYQAKTTLEEYSLIVLGDKGEYLGMLKIAVAGVLFGFSVFGILNANRESVKNKSLYVMMFIALISGVLVNPVIRSTDVIYKKPVSLEFEKIKEEKPSALWVGDDTGWYLNNYMVANGLRTINSTNVYPNLDFFEKLLGERAEELRHIYNRYEHMNVNIIDGPSDVTLAFNDSVIISLNYKDLQKFGIEYIVSKKDLNQKGFDMKFEQLYYDGEIYNGIPEETLAAMMYESIYIFKPVYE